MKTFHLESDVELDTSSIQEAEDSILAEKLLADLRRCPEGTTVASHSDGVQLESDHNDQSKQNETKEEGIEEQLHQLQGLVGDMREGFSSALKTLTDLRHDDNLYQTVALNKSTQEHHLADIVSMIITLKNEFNGVVSQLQAATDAQKDLERQVSVLRVERDMLLEELERNGSVSSQLRLKCQSLQTKPQQTNLNTNLNNNQSTSHLSLLLEKAHNVFNTSVLNRTCPPNFITDPCETANSSDHDSGCQTHRQDSLPSSCEEGSPVADRRAARSSFPLNDSKKTVSDLVQNEDSDSDCSVKAAANRSLDLSRSLADQCNLDNDEDEIDVDLCPSVQQGTPLKSKPSTPHKIAPHERLSKIAARQRVIEELVETERTYCSSLWCVMQNFALPVAESGLLLECELQVIFPSSLSAIYEHHCTLLRQLEDRLHSSSVNTGAVIGDIIARAFESSESKVLKEYQSYVTAFPDALHHLHKSCRNLPSLKTLLRDLKQESNGAMDVTAYMLTPIQRIPRYVLLLKQVLQKSPSEHPDSYNLDKCVTFLESFLSQLNDSMQQSMQLISMRRPQEKPKRKLRLGSFRSLSTSAYDNKSKIDTVTPRMPRPLSAAAEPRGQHLSALRETLVQNKMLPDKHSTLGPFLAPPTSTPRHMPLLPPDLGIQSEKRRFPRAKRPKSAVSIGAVNKGFMNSPQNLSLIEPDGESNLKPRPQSMIDSSRLLDYSSEESLNTDTLSSARSIHFSNDVSHYEFDDDEDTLNGSIPDLPIGASATSTLERSPIKPSMSEACLSPSSATDSSVLSQSACDLSVMNATLTAATTANRSFLKWKRRKKGSEVFADSAIRKRPSIRESLKSFFVRKRTSKAFDLDSTLSVDGSQSMESLPTVTAVRPPSSPNSTKEQAPPNEPSIVVTAAECDTTLDLSSYDDENGDPCSAV